jgi:pheromone shutdown protein TraB
MSDEQEPETIESMVSRMTPIERLKLAIAILKKMPSDIQILIEAMNDPDVAKEVSDLAIQLIRVIPELQKRMAVEALKRVGIL